LRKYADCERDIFRALLYDETRDSKCQGQPSQQSRS
jgi:hypothetical protein